MQTFRDLRSDNQEFYHKRLFQTLPTKYSSEASIMKNRNFKKPNKNSKLNLQHLLIKPEFVSSLDENEHNLSNNLEKLPNKYKNFHSEEKKINSSEDINLIFPPTEPKDKNRTLSNESFDNDKKIKKTLEYESKEFTIDSDHEIKKISNASLNKSLNFQLKTSPYIESKISAEITNEKNKSKNLFLYDFDSILSFSHYFPQGNIQNIVHKYKRSRSKSFSPKRNGRINFPSLPKLRNKS